MTAAAKPTSGRMAPSTAFLLLAQYSGCAVIPLELVRADYFASMSQDKFLRQIYAGKIPLPVVRMTNSRKSPRGVHLNDLANYIDQARESALKEFEQLAAEDIADHPARSVSAGRQR